MNLVRIIFIVALAIIAGGLIYMAVGTAGNANAGQTTGFAPYAKQGIVNQLIRVYGKNGIPYVVTCSDRSAFPNQGRLVDTVTCRITEKLGGTM